MSGIFGATTIKGNRLTDVAGQTATVGIPIPFGYGKFPSDGNVIWAGTLVEHVTKKKQGKGGVQTEEYSYTLSYAIAFAAGPIYGYLTIKRDGKVVYTTDPNATIDDKAYAAKWAQKATFYYGTREQMPDSTIEAVKGAGKVSAFRDLAYIVVEDDDVTANGGAAPNYQAVVIATPPEVYITSRPYAVEVVEDYQSTAQCLRGRTLQEPIEEFDASAQFVSGTLRELVKTFTAPIEEFDASAQFVSGTLRELVKTFTAPTEEFDASAQFVSGTLKVVVKSYTTKPEELDASASFISGTLA